MTTFSVIPGVLNFTIKRGDRFTSAVDFSTALIGYSLEAHVYSVIDRAVVKAIDANIVSESDGVVQLALSSAETAGVEPGTYRWKLRWDAGGSTFRTALEGFFEVLP